MHSVSRLPNVNNCSSILQDRADASPVSVDINDPSLTGHSMTETGSRFTDRYASFTQIIKLSARHPILANNKSKTSISCVCCQGTDRHTVFSIGVRKVKKTFMKD
eukprot:868_1